MNEGSEGVVAFSEEDAGIIGTHPVEREQMLPRISSLLHENPTFDGGILV